MRPRMRQQVDGSGWSKGSHVRRSLEPRLCEVWRPLGLSGCMQHLSVTHYPSPRIGACAPVCAEAVKSTVCSGFEPAKALVRWLLLPRPRILPSPVRGLPITTGGVGLRMVRGVNPGWAGVVSCEWEKHNLEGGKLLPAQPFVPARHPRYAWASVQWLNPFGRR
jgi:hypothetical protein